MLEQAYEEFRLWRFLVMAPLVDIRIKAEFWNAHCCNYIVTSQRDVAI